MRTSRRLQRVEERVYARQREAIVRTFDAHGEPATWPELAALPVEHRKCVAWLYDAFRLDRKAFARGVLPASLAPMPAPLYLYRCVMCERGTHSDDTPSREEH